MILRIVIALMVFAAGYLLWTESADARCCGRGRGRQVDRQRSVKVLRTARRSTECQACQPAAGLVDVPIRKMPQPPTVQAVQDR